VPDVCGYAIVGSQARLRPAPLPSPTICRNEIASQGESCCARDRPANSNPSVNDRVRLRLISWIPLRVT
jgi:hypothetical protein